MVGSAFTGQKEPDENAPLQDIVGKARNTASSVHDALLGDPASRSTLLQIGLGLMTPSWNNTGGHIAQAIGGGGEAEARLAKEEFERQKHEDELDKTNRTLTIRQQEADAYSKAQEAAAARGTAQDKITLEQLRQQGRAALLSTKNYAAHAKNTADLVNDITFDPKRPENAPLLKFVGKTPSQIETMLRQEDMSATVEPPKGSSVGKPKTVRQGGVTYTLGDDGEYH